MCFFTRNPKVRISNKDIVVYKIVNGFVEDDGKKYYTSLFYGKDYELGELNEEIEIEPYNPYRSIKKPPIYRVEKGYHSYISIEEIVGNNTSMMMYPKALVKCIVPKGSKYMKNDSEIVSSNIIIEEEIQCT